MTGSHDYVDIAKGPFFKQHKQPNKATVLWKCTTDLRSLHHFLGFHAVKASQQKRKMWNTKREAKHSRHVSHVVTTF